MVEEAVEVTVKAAGQELKFSGDPDTVVRELFKFLTKVYPSLELVSKISITVDVERFLTDCQGIFAVTPEGVVITAPAETLSDKELILLHLTRMRFAHLTSKSAKDTLLISDLITATKGKSGTIAGRLSEMVSEGLVERIGKGEYRATTYGLDNFQRTVIPKLKETRK